MKNRSNRQQRKETEPEEVETEGEKVKNRQKQAKADTLDLFALLDFLDDDDDDDDYEPPVRRRRKGKAVPLLLDDEDEKNKDNGDDNNEEEDENYEVEEGNNDDEEDDEEIMLQAGKAEQRKQKRPTAVTKSKDTDMDMVVEERRTLDQHCANVDQAMEFRKYICDVMKTFEEHVRKGKQVKKYLLEMIEDVREACMNMQYPGMDFSLEEIVPTISDPSFKAW